MGKVEHDNELIKSWFIKRATFTSDDFFGSAFSSFFNVWAKDVYSKWKFGLFSFDI